MDVLQLLKDDYAPILAEAQELAAATTKKAVTEKFSFFYQMLTNRLLLETNYLYPEISDLFSEADLLADAQKRQKALKKSLEKWQKNIASKKWEMAEFRPAIVALLKQLELHFMTEEMYVLPKMRKLISTADREDLAFVFLDAKNEMAGAAVQSEIKASKTKAKKARA